MYATVENMRKVVTGPAVFAYSPYTGERYSAAVGDYWDQADDFVLRDETGRPMILAYEAIHEWEGR